MQALQAGVIYRPAPVPIRTRLTRNPGRGLLALMATLAVPALLLVFGLVVQAGVRSAERRHAAEALRAAALWRCKALRGAVREPCLQAWRDSRP